VAADVVARSTCRLGGGTGSGERLGTRRPASCGHPRCRARAICARDPGHCEQPDGRPGNRNVPGCAGSSPAVHDSLDDHRGEGKKRLCCVTTRRRKRWLPTGLGRGLGTPAARALCLSMPGFDAVILAMFGLPPRRLPLANQPQADWALAVALVPTPRLVFTSASFAQADARAGSAPSGWTAVLSRTLVDAHGSCHSHGKSSGRM
jgi:hypothetical protein